AHAEAEGMWVVGGGRLEGAVPVGVLDVDGVDLDAVAAGVGDDGGGAVEAHGLGVEQGAGEFGGVMAAQVGGGVAYEGETCGVAFGEAVVGEAFDLLEDAFGEFQSDAFF